MTDLLFETLISIYSKHHMERDNKQNIHRRYTNCLLK